MTRYVELCAASNFSFLRGASHPDELVFQASALGLDALAVTDINTLAGVVRAHSAAKKSGFRFIVGVRIRFADETPDILFYPTDRAAYGRICKMLTRGKRRARKGECELFRNDALEFGEGQLCAILHEGAGNFKIGEALGDFAGAFPGNVWLAAARRFRDDDRRQLNMLAQIAARAGAPMLAVADALYHVPERRSLQDVLHCIRNRCSIDDAGRALMANAERHLKAPQEMARLFSDHPQAIFETIAVAERSLFSLDELRYEYPDEVSGPSATPQEELERLTWIGAEERYPEGVPEKVRKAIFHELSLIKDLSYAPYFLTVGDIVSFARSRDIYCQGRGSAANSAVCYCLGVTSVDPTKVDLLFERFVSAERDEPPDIDVDFEHERREEVIQHIYEKYGRERAGIAATIITYRARSAIREVGKALGLSEDVTSGLARGVWGHSSSFPIVEHAKESGLDADGLRIKTALALANDLIGFPRHLSQHTGGFVVTRGALDEVMPIGNAAMSDRTFVEWDKDDLDALGIIKVDVLGLGMLTCIAKALRLLREHYACNHSIASIPPDELSVYDMICRADTLGVFQIESRAQMSMLPRLKPRNFYDLVIEVAIVRPGPIQGDMVHPYLRRRAHQEKVVYPSQELEDVLGKTLGVPLFQEQAMKIAIVAAGFTPSEADDLRRAMATFRRTGAIHQYRDKMVYGMIARGYQKEFAERCFRQIEGFGEYGFPESHAASFALLVYISCWLKCHYPDVFCAALINSQPMGFYAPAQIVRDACEHGVPVLPVDVNYSGWDTTLEKGPARGVIHDRHAQMEQNIYSTHAVRLGFRQIKGLSKEDARRIEDTRGEGFNSVRDFQLRTGLDFRALQRLANADAFGSIGLSRRAALWAVEGLGKSGRGESADLFAAQEDIRKEQEVALPMMSLGEEVAYDYKTLKLSLKSHPIALLRRRLDREKYIINENLRVIKNNAYVRVCGLLLVRQRPGTANGVTFATLEDETSIANIIIWPKVFEQFRRALLDARCLGVEGKLQREGGVIHVIAVRLVNLTPLLALLSDYHEEMDDGIYRADEFKHPVADDLRMAKLQRQENVKTRMKEILPAGRNFH
ncbi:MAG: error-prone DNA polymerase [Alphaproteobacteria bacterium RIFCSPHIGHO2_12_FULL_63_12]|nr:MAG: error-prone DNA polymerase [Alphaproteobacteria bacterium RIFCSPHIGHO2_12_FULL_63_12]